MAAAVWDFLARTPAYAAIPKLLQQLFGGFGSKSDLQHTDFCLLERPD
jgi:hypothetical protein